MSWFKPDTCFLDPLRLTFPRLDSVAADRRYTTYRVAFRRTLVVHVVRPPASTTCLFLLFAFAGTRQPGYLPSPCISAQTFFMSV